MKKIFNYLTFISALIAITTVTSGMAMQQPNTNYNQPKLLAPHRCDRVQPIYVQQPGCMQKIDSTCPNCLHQIQFDLLAPPTNNPTNVQASNHMPSTYDEVSQLDPSKAKDFIKRFFYVNPPFIDALIKELSPVIPSSEIYKHIFTRKNPPINNKKPVATTNNPDNILKRFLPQCPKQTPQTISKEETPEITVASSSTPTTIDNQAQENKKHLSRKAQRELRRQKNTNEKPEIKRISTRIKPPVRRKTKKYIKQTQQESKRLADAQQTSPLAVSPVKEQEKRCQDQQTNHAITRKEETAPYIQSLVSELIDQAHRQAILCEEKNKKETASFVNTIVEKIISQGQIEQEQIELEKKAGTITKNYIESKKPELLDSKQRELEQLELKQLLLYLLPPSPLSKELREAILSCIMQHSIMKGDPQTFSLFLPQIPSILFLEKGIEEDAYNIIIRDYRFYVNIVNAPFFQQASYTYKVGLINKIVNRIHICQKALGSFCVGIIQKLVPCLTALALVPEDKVNKTYRDDLSKYIGTFLDKALSLKDEKNSQIVIDITKQLIAFINKPDHAKHTKPEPLIRNMKIITQSPALTTIVLESDKFSELTPGEKYSFLTDSITAAVSFNDNDNEKKLVELIVKAITCSDQSKALQLLLDKAFKVHAKKEFFEIIIKNMKISLSKQNRKRYINKLAEKIKEQNESTKAKECLDLQKKFESLK